MGRIEDSRQQGGAKTIALVLMAYLLITVAMTWPLAIKFTTHVTGGDFDSMTFIWSNWWVKHALADLHTTPFKTDYIFYPHEVGLAFHAMVLLNGLASIPLQNFMGLPAINNLFLYLSFVLSGIGAYLLIGHTLKDRRAAFLGGLIFAFSPYKMWRLEGHMNYSMTQWMPFYALYLFKAFEGDKASLRHAALAGMFLGFNLLSEHYFFIFMIVLTAVFVAHQVLAGACLARKAFWRVFLIGVFSVPFLIPNALATIEEAMSGRTRALPSLVKTSFVVDLSGFFRPPPESTIWPRFIEAGTSMGAEGYGFLGFIAMALALTGWLRNRSSDRAVSFWALVFVVFAVLSLGPYLYVFGKKTGVPLPYYLFHYVPFLDNMRAPGRFVVVSMLGVAVLSAYGIKYLAEKRKYLYIALAPLILLEYARAPLSLADATVPPVYAEIAKNKDAGSVLEVPFFRQDGYDNIGRAMPKQELYQTVHGKKIFSGFVSRLGEAERAFLSSLNMPVIRKIIVLEKGLPAMLDTVELDRRIGREFARLFRVGYVVVHKTVPTGGAHDFVKYVLPLKKIYEDDKLVAYMVLVEKKKAGDAVDLGTEASIPHLFRGWINGLREGDTTYAFSAGTESLLFLDLEAGRDYVMRLRMRPHENFTEKKISLYVNDEFLADIPLGLGWYEYTGRLPAKSVKEGLNTVAFRAKNPVATDEEFRAVWDERTRLEKETLGHLVGTFHVSRPLDWEQDNSRFRGSRVSVAVDYVVVE